MCNVLQFKFFQLLHQKIYRIRYAADDRCEYCIERMPALRWVLQILGSSLALGCRFQWTLGIFRINIDKGQQSKARFWFWGWRLMKILSFPKSSHVVKQLRWKTTIIVNLIIIRIFTIIIIIFIRIPLIICDCYIFPNIIKLNKPPASKSFFIFSMVRSSLPRYLKWKFTCNHSIAKRIQHHHHQLYYYQTLLLSEVLSPLTLPPSEPSPLKVKPAVFNFDPQVFHKVNLKVDHVIGKPFDTRLRDE